LSANDLKPWRERDFKYMIVVAEKLPEIGYSKELRHGYDDDGDPTRDHASKIQHIALFLKNSTT
jgi:hypothetical protein